MPKYCDECGTKISGSEKFCVECGHQLIQDKKNKPTPQSVATTHLDHTLTLQKSYLIFGIISIIIAVAFIFGINIANSLIVISEILIILGGILLIFAYELIFRKKSYVLTATIGCIFGCTGSFFPFMISLKDWYQYGSALIYPLLYFIIFSIYLIFLIATLIWRSEDKGLKKELKVWHK